MDAYFVDLGVLRVRDEDMDELWKKNLVAVRRSGEDWAGSKQGYQKTHEKRAEKALHVISEEGAYVWLQSPRSGSAKVGRVMPGEPEGFSAILHDPPVPKLEDADHLKTALKTLRLVDIREAAPYEAMDLRSLRPPMGFLGSWGRGKHRLAALVEGEPVERTWRNLRPEIKLSVCAEYLRSHEDPRRPRLSRLLLPMKDRDPGKAISGPYDVDILGLKSDGDEILAQIPFREDNFKYSLQMNRKLKALKKQEGGSRKLVCFWDFVSATIGGTPPRADAEPLYWDGVLLIAVEDVLRWVESQSEYAETLFSS